MSGANPLEGLVHNPVTCVEISSHAVQYAMPIATAIATMAGYANEKKPDIELGSLKKIEKYRKASRDIIVSDAIVMKGLACITKPMSKEDREELAREPGASGSNELSREPGASAHLTKKSSGNTSTL